MNSLNGDTRACAPTVLTSNLPTELPRRVAVGLSGGLDSTVLLHWLATQRPNIELSAIHCHHGLQAQADEWARHCRRVCDSLQVPCQVVKLDTQSIRDHGAGMESGARTQRLQAYADHANGAVIALAHHQDDQAETFLLRALRGSSVDGLGGMRQFTSVQGLTLWRPLLQCSRIELEHYARANDLQWIDDPSNADDQFDRNFLRNQVIPLLQGRWPAATQRLAESARLAALDSDALLAHEMPVSAPNRRLLLETSDPHARARAIRAWLRTHQLPPLPASAFQALEHCLSHGRSDSDFAITWLGGELRYWRAALYLMNPALPAWIHPISVTVPAQTRRSETFADGSTLTIHNRSAEPLSLSARPRRGGERVILPGRDHSTAVKDLLNRSEVPPWQRSYLPLIYGSDNELWWIGSLHCSQAYMDVAQRADIDVTWRTNDLN